MVELFQPLAGSIGRECIGMTATTLPIPRKGFTRQCAFPPPRGLTRTGEAPGPAASGSRGRVLSNGMAKTSLDERTWEKKRGGLILTHSHASLGVGI